MPRVAVTARLARPLRGRRAPWRSRYLRDRLLLAAKATLGASIGVLVNATVLPPLHLRPAESATRRLRDGVTALLADMARKLEEEWPPEDRPDFVGRARDLNPHVGQARVALRQAAESTRYNPRGRRWGGSPRRTEDALDGLQNVTVGVTAIARTLDEAGDPGEEHVTLEDSFRADYADILRDTAAMVDTYAIPQRRDPDTAELSDTLVKVRRLQTDGKPPRADLQRTWLAEGHLLIQVERILGELLAIPGGPRG